MAIKLCNPWVIVVVESWWQYRPPLDTGLDNNKETHTHLLCSPAVLIEREVSQVTEGTTVIGSRQLRQRRRFRMIEAPAILLVSLFSQRIIRCLRHRRHLLLGNWRMNADYYSLGPIDLIQVSNQSRYVPSSRPVILMMGSSLPGTKSRPGVTDRHFPIWISKHQDTTTFLQVLQ